MGEMFTKVVRHVLSHAVVLQHDRPGRGYHVQLLDAGGHVAGGAEVGQPDLDKAEFLLIDIR